MVGFVREFIVGLKSNCIVEEFLSIALNVVSNVPMRTGKTTYEHHDQSTAHMHTVHCDVIFAVFEAKLHYEINTWQ